MKVKRLIFDGDSLFSRGNANLANGKEAPLAAYSALTGVRPPMFNFAVSGKSITQLIDDFPTKIAPWIRPGDVVVFNELTNELNTVQNPTTVLATLQSYEALVVALGGVFYPYTCPARNTGYAGFEADRLTLNAAIRTAYGSKTIDAGGLTEFNSVAATASATYYDADTLHFKSAGYTLYGATAAPVIQAEFV